MQPAPVEWYAASLQATMIAGLATLCGVLYSRYRKPYFLWWTIAWFFYSVRISAIFMFAFTEQQVWLYVVQAAAGYSAVALLWAAIVFFRQPPSRWWYIAFVVVPPLWPYLAMYRFDSVLLASTAPALLQTVGLYWSCILFAQFSLAVKSRAALLLAVTFGAWALYLMRFSVLSSTGVWDAVALYGNILFLLAVGVGILLLVNEDLHRGLNALSVLSGDLQPGSGRRDDMDSLLDRPLALAGVHGSALFLGNAGNGRFVRGRGSAALWEGTQPAEAARTAIAETLTTGRPHSGRGWNGEAGSDKRSAAGAEEKRHAYAAVLPLSHAGQMIGALVIVGDTRDPFTALGDSFLVALGQQVGAALENADLYRRVEARTRELQHLSRQMVRQHEDERRRMALELHDETAQLLSAVKMALGMERRHADPGQATRLEHVLTLVDRGIRSIRGVVNQLRPPLLDDLGLVTALRAMVAELGGRGSITATFDSPDQLLLDPEAEFAVFRVVQEALSNVVRHSGATRVAVRVSATSEGAEIVIEDDGIGFRPVGAAGGEAEATSRVLVLERTGITGMRARLAAVGGSLELSAREDGGARLRAYVTTVPAQQTALAAAPTAQ